MMNYRPLQSRFSPSLQESYWVYLPWSISILYCAFRLILQLSFTFGLYLASLCFPNAGCAPLVNQMTSGG